MNMNEMYATAAGIWIFVGVGFHFIVTRPIVRRIMQRRGIPGDAIRAHAVVLALLADVVTWPIGLSTFLFSVARSLWKTRHTFKMSILGYWPLAAHSSNAVGHWAHIREKVRDGTASIEDLGHFDQHMAELGYCLKKQYKMNSGFPPDSEVEPEVQPAPEPVPEKAKDAPSVCCRCRIGSNLSSPLMRVPGDDSKTVICYNCCISLVYDECIAHMELNGSEVGCLICREEVETPMVQVRTSVSVHLRCCRKKVAEILANRPSMLESER